MDRDSRRALLNWAVLVGSLSSACGESSPRLEGGPSIQYIRIVEIGAEGSNAKAGCITRPEFGLGGGVIDLTSETETSFTDSGELSNSECVLAMALIDGHAQFVAGPALDIDLALPGSDGDSVSHSIATAEDRARNGTFGMKLFPRDALGDESRKLWSGELFVGDLDERMRIARLGVE